MEFSLGMGHWTVKHFTKGGTKYSWKLLPFGGSCMMLGKMKERWNRGICSSIRMGRISVIAAGPVMLLFWHLCCPCFIIGSIEFDKTGDPAR